jgi:hypothetical protein
MCLFVSLSWGRGQGEGELGSSVLYVFFVVKSGLKSFPPCEALTCIAPSRQRPGCIGCGREPRDRPLPAMRDSLLAGFIGVQSAAAAARLFVLH